MARVSHIPSPTPQRVGTITAMQETLNNMAAAIGVLQDRTTELESEVERQKLAQQAIVAEFPEGTF